MRRLFVLFFLCLLGVSAVGVPSELLTSEQRELLERFDRIFAPLAEARGRRLRIEIKAGSPLVVASAEYRGDSEVISIHEGLLRAPRLSKDTLAIVLCHELGHLHGGEPFRPFPLEWEGPFDPISAEGQSDYFATKSCFHRLMDGEDHLAALGDRGIPSRVRSLCAGLGDGNQAALCVRAAFASLDFLRLVFEFAISLETADPTVVERTEFKGYPGRQCRLDTLVAGAAGLERPACWFKP